MNPIWFELKKEQNRPWPTCKNKNFSGVFNGLKILFSAIIGKLKFLFIFDKEKSFHILLLDIMDLFIESKCPGIAMPAPIILEVSNVSQAVLIISIINWFICVTLKSFNSFFRL